MTDTMNHAELFSEPALTADEQLDRAIRECQIKTGEMFEAERLYRVNSRERLDTIMELILAFGQRWLIADADFLNDAYAVRQIGPTPDGGNDYLQLIYMLTGREDHEAKPVSYEGQTGLVKFHKGKSLAKYAGALRLMHELDIQPVDVSDFIENFHVSYPGFGKRLNGMIAMDRQRHAAPVRNMFVNETAVLDHAATRAVNDNPFMDSDWKGELLQKPRTFALAWGVVIDGQFFPGGTIKKSEAKAKSAALANVKEAA